MGRTWETFRNQRYFKDAIGNLIANPCCGLVCVRVHARIGRERGPSVIPPNNYRYNFYKPRIRDEAVTKAI